MSSDELLVYSDTSFSFLGFGTTTVDAEFDAFLQDSHTPIRFLLDVNAVELSEDDTDEPDVPAWSDLSYSELAGGDVRLGSRLWFFSDGRWVGKPTDALRPNTTADARIMQVADIQRVIPLQPEAQRRSEVIVGEFILANPDGELDELSARYSIAGRPVRLYVGRPTDDFTDFRQLAMLFGQDTEGDLREMRLKVQPAQVALSTPLQSSRYSGLGGIDGDPSLVQRLKPVCLGQCFNITPVLLNQDQWIYQVNDGSIYGVTAVKERGLPFVDSGVDVTTYTALRSTTVAGGQFATCKTLGLVKVGLGSGPTGPVTMDVLGDASTSGYVSTVGAILFRAAITRARMPSAYLDIGTFDDLDAGPCGFYADGGTEYSVADLFDALLRGQNGWYGSTRDRLLRVAKLRAPEDFEAIYIEEDEIVAMEELELDPPARYEQAVAYQKNWTVMGVGDVSAALDADVSQTLQLPYKTTKRTSAEAQVRHLTAIRGDTIETYMAELSDAEAAMDNIMQLHRVTRRLFRIEVQRTGLRRSLDNDAVVSLRLRTRTALRFGLTEANKFLIISTRLDGKAGRVEFVLWG